jgi:hypothetical protein
VLDAMDDPSHPDHAEITNWHEGYDPTQIDEARIRAGLSAIANKAMLQTSAGRRWILMVEVKECVLF